jgi:hypothetical protein
VCLALVEPGFLDQLFSMARLLFQLLNVLLLSSTAAAHIVEKLSIFSIAKIALQWLAFSCKSETVNPNTDSVVAITGAKLRYNRSKSLE